MWRSCSTLPGSFGPPGPAADLKARPIKREFIEGRLSYLDTVSELNIAVADREEAAGTPLIETGKGSS